MYGIYQCMLSRARAHARSTAPCKIKTSVKDTGLFYERGYTSPVQSNINSTQIKYALHRLGAALRQERRPLLLHCGGGWGGEDLIRPRQ
jgi:hypothetical protein